MNKCRSDIHTKSWARLSVCTEQRQSSFHWYESVCVSFPWLPCLHICWINSDLNGNTWNQVCVQLQKTGSKCYCVFYCMRYQSSWTAPKNLIGARHFQKWPQRWSADTNSSLQWFSGTVSVAPQWINDRISPGKERSRNYSNWRGAGEAWLPLLVTVALAQGWAGGRVKRKDKNGRTRERRITGRISHRVIK